MPDTEYITYPVYDEMVASDPSVEKEWAKLTESDKRKYMKRAIWTIDNVYDYIGDQVLRQSEHAFPRDFTAYIDDPTNLRNLLVRYNKRVPRQVRDAVVEISKILVKGKTLTQVNTMKEQLGVSRVKISSVEIEMEETGDIYKAIRQLLAPYMMEFYSFRSFV